MSRRIGDSLNTEIALVNASFTWLLRGDWDMLFAELDEWLDGRPVTSTEAMLHVSRFAALAARGRGTRGHETTTRTQRTRGSSTARSSPWRWCRADEGDVTGAATAAAASAHRTYGSGEMLEDFELGWAPVVELQLRAGDLDEAESVLVLATPLLGGRSRAITRGGVPAAARR